MDGILIVIGRVSGLVGFILCAAAAFARVKGFYWLGGYQVGTLLLAGVAALIFGAFCLLWVVANRLHVDR